MGEFQVCFEAVGQDWHLSKHCSSECWPYFIRQDQTEESTRTRTSEFQLNYKDASGSMFEQTLKKKMPLNNLVCGLIT